MGKKLSGNWKIAIDYYLTAVFVPNILGNIVLKSFSVLGITNTNLILLLSFVVMLLVLWLGTMYAAHYINSKYIINNKRHLIKSAVACFLVINIVLAIVMALIQNSMILELIISITGSIILVFPFSFLSKKYLKVSENTEIQQNTI